MLQNTHKLAQSAETLFIRAPCPLLLAHLSSDIKHERLTLMSLAYPMWAQSCKVGQPWCRLLLLTGLLGRYPDTEQLKAL